MSVLFSLSMLPIAANSFADDTPAESSPSVPTQSALRIASVSDRGKNETRWYGAEIIIGTLACDAVFVGGVLAANKDMKVAPYMMIAGLVGRVITPPAIHYLGHGNGTKAWESLALQTLAPIVAGGVGLGVSYGLVRAGELTEPHVPIVEIMITLASAGAGAIAATVIDAAVLAKERVKPPRAMTGRGQSWNVMPVPTIDSKRAGLSLIGQF